MLSAISPPSAAWANIVDPSSPNCSSANAIASSRVCEFQMSAMAPLTPVIAAFASASRMSVSAQHAMTPMTRSGAIAAVDSAYAPPVDTPTA